MEIKENHNGTVTIVLKEKFLLDEAIFIRDAIHKFLHKGYRSFKFDFNQVTDIDISSLGVLVNIQRKSMQAGAKIIIEKLHESIRKLFEVTRLAQSFNI